MGYPTLLDWESVQHKLPWNVVILLGSGFAIAAGADVGRVCEYIKLIFVFIVEIRSVLLDW